MAKKQVVEVVFPSGGKTYSYVADGNVRTGQKIENAPVSHYTKKGVVTSFSTAPVTVVATHQVEGVNVGDRIGVSGGVVHSIPKPLKFLPGNRELQEDRKIKALDGETTQEYMQPFNPRMNLLGYKKPSSSSAREQLLGV